MANLKILPTCGEGDREAVEGGVPLCNAGGLHRPPSVSLRLPPPRKRGGF